MDHIKAEISFRRHNPMNCISINTKPHIIRVLKGQGKHFVPSLFLSNVMSLSPKIDEVSHVVQNANFDLVCITESWLQEHIPDSAVAINGYNLIRRDKKESTHGGVCMYIKDTIPSSVFDNFEDVNGPELEVLWVKLRPN